MNNNNHHCVPGIGVKTYIGIYTVCLCERGKIRFLPCSLKNKCSTAFFIVFNQFDMYVPKHLQYLYQMDMSLIYNNNSCIRNMIQEF